MPLRREPRDEGGPGRRMPYGLALLVLAGSYVLTGRLGLSLAHLQTNATLFWAPTGISLAALILYGRKLWPGVFLGSLITNLSLPETPWATGLGIAVGNTAEAWTGAWLLQRAVGFRPTFERLRDVAAFVPLGALSCTLLGATVGVSSLWAGGVIDANAYGMVWLVWWLGDVGGALVAAPLVMLGVHGTPSWRRLLGSAEAWMVGVGVVASGAVAFGGITAGPWALLAAFLPIPFLAWAGSRLGSRGTVLASGVIWLLAIWGTQQGRGPFVGEGVHTNFMLLWAYGTTLGAAALMLAAAVGQRENTQRLRDREASEHLAMVQRINQVQRLEGMGLLAGGVAHDFNNILATIRGNAELLSAELPDRQAQKADSIVAASDRAADLCRRLMAYAGQETPVMEPVVLGRLTRETQELLAGSTPRDVVVTREEHHPEVVVEGEETLLRQVVMNLIQNAVEAFDSRVGAKAETAGNAEGPVGAEDPEDPGARGSTGRVALATGRVDLDAHALDRMVGARNAKPGRHGFVSVTDDGGGIETEVQERMFDPFFTTKPEGRGLGLSGVLGILNSHGGAIEVATEVGQGTRIVAYLPLAETPPDERPVTITPRSGDAGPPRVLVVDDEEDVRMVVRMTLESAGFEVVDVGDGAGAIEVFRQGSQRFDAVLLDVVMPRLSGVETRERLLALDPELAIVLMSGYQALGAVELVGEDAFLRKPFAGGELVERVSQAVARSREGVPAATP